MENCWFKLKQTHYVAPDVETLGTAIETSAICLGHIISDLEHLDQVLNRGRIKPFKKATAEDTLTREFTVWPSKVIDFDWSNTVNTSHGAHGQASAPLAGVGATGNASIKAIFQESVTNFAHFDSLEYVTFQPDEKYAKDASEVEEVKSEIAKQKLLKVGWWSLYMITGLVIARNGKYKRAEERRRNVQAGLGGAVIGSVSAETGGDTNVQHTQSAAGTVTTDIVWALRLQKMYGNPLKELFGFGWSIKTETVGTTFDDSEDDDLDVIAVLKGEGQQGEKIRVLEDNDFNVAVVSIVGDY